MFTTSRMEVTEHLTVENRYQLDPPLKKLPWGLLLRNAFISRIVFSLYLSYVSIIKREELVST